MVLASPWPRPAASSAIFRQDAVLLVKRAKPPFVGLWSLPGGHIEPGEAARDAALRELAEETGIVARLLGLAAVVDAIHAPGGELAAHYVICVYHGIWQAGEPAAASDAADAKFIAISKCAELPLTAGLAGTIATAWRLANGPQVQP